MRQKTKVKKLTSKDLSELFMSNPFVNKEFEIRVRHLRLNNTFKVGRDGVHLPAELEMECSSSTKVYIKAEYRKVVSFLSGGSQRLYLHILYELNYGLDYIEINVDRYMEENGISSINTYRVALKELCRYLFIYPSLVKGVYWINPKYFFCGSRVNKYPDNVVKKRARENK